MRLKVFSMILTAAICVFAHTCARAYDVPHIENEDVFNAYAEDISSGGLKLNIGEIIKSIKDSLVKEIKESGEYIAAILCIAAMSGVINALSSSFGGSKTADFACFSLMSMAALRAFTITLSYGTTVIDGVCDFINKVTPVFITALYACGSITTASAFEPILSASVYIISVVIEKCLVPLICFSSILSIAGNIDDEIRITNFRRVVRSLSKWIMGAIITVFTAISAVYGFSAPALDAVGGKAVKFAVGTLVPVVGGFLSDTLDTVLSGTKLMKNAVGIGGMIAICTMCIVPIIKIFAVQLILKLGAALCEPMADKRVSSMLWEVSDCVMTIMAVVIMIMVLFLVNIGIILSATGF